MLPSIPLGPLELQTFGLSLAFAFLCSGLVAQRRLRELGRPADWAYEALLAAAIGGIVGAHLDYVVQNWSLASRDFWGTLFSGTGLVFFGGLAGGAAAVALWGWWRDYLGLELLDWAAPAVAIGYAVGRIGCQVSGDGDYGIASSLPWAMAYPDGTVPTLETVHPTPIYETVAMGLVTLGLWRLRDRMRPGGLAALYLVVAGLERFLVEFIRRNSDLIAGLTLAQVIALAMASAGAVLLGWSRRPRGVAPA